MTIVMTLPNAHEISLPYVFLGRYMDYLMSNFVDHSLPRWGDLKNWAKIKNKKKKKNRQLQSFLLF